MANIHIHAPLCIAAGAVFPPVCIAIVGMRFQARRQQNVAIGIDDWLTLPALALVLGMCIALLIGVARHSIGYPTPPKAPGKTLITMSSYEQTTTRQVYWSIEMMQVLALTCIKLSFVFFFRRIFNQGVGRIFRTMTVVMLAIIGLWGAGFFFSILFICGNQPWAYWARLIDAKQHCVDTVTLHNALGVSDFIIDVLIFIMPIWPIMRLQMSNLKKLAVLGIFGLGAFSIVTSILRMVTYVQSTAVEFLPQTDFDILITGGTYWSVVEAGTALISLCLPTIQHVFKRKVSQSTYARTFRKSGMPIAPDTGYTSRSKGYRQKRDSEISEIELGHIANGTSADAEGHSGVYRETPADAILVTREFGVSELSKSNHAV